MCIQILRSPRSGTHHGCLDDLWPGYASGVRDVSTATKEQAYAEYSMNYPQVLGAYQVDHSIPLELGGSNDITNLWPEPATPMPGFHQKDQFENFEHDQVCNHK